MEEWTIAYRKPGGISAWLGFSSVDIKILSLRFHPRSGRTYQSYVRRDRVSREKMQTLEPAVQNIVQRVLEQRQTHTFSSRNDWDLFNLEARTLVPAPRLYGDSLHECHFVLMRTNETV